MTRIENVVKEIKDMKDIVCENETCADNECGGCPLYSSVHGCRFDYVNDELEYIYRK